MSPFQCPSLFTILSFLEYEYGVWHPIGGCGAITAAMAKACREMGVKMRLAEPVEKILFEGKAAVGVKTARADYAADAVVIGSDFANTMMRMVPDELRRRWSDRKIESRKFSCSTFMMYLGIEGSYPHLEHHTIWLADNYQENLADIEDRHVLSKRPSFYVQNACKTDPTLSRAGQSTLYVLVPVTHKTDNVDWERERGRFRQVVIDQLKQIGIDKLEKRIRFERIVTPRDWETEQHIFRAQHLTWRTAWIRCCTAGRTIGSRI